MGIHQDCPDEYQEQQGPLHSHHAGYHYRYRFRDSDHLHR